MQAELLASLLFFATVRVRTQDIDGGGPEKTANKQQQQPPNIIYILGDDIGYNDVGWNNPNIHTPHMNKLAKEGVILDQYYALPLCTPSRSTLLTGMYAQQLGLQRGVLSTQEPYGVPLRYKLLPEILKRRGYSTHAIGKWHLGFCDWRYTPTYRGFDTFLGFYQGGQENYYHCLSAHHIFDPVSNCSLYDFRDGVYAAQSYNGDYSTYVYNDRAVEVIKLHASQPNKGPLFMYVALTASHFPVQGDKYVSECQNDNKWRRQFCGSMVGIDEAVHNISEALKASKLYDNSILVFASDNGGSVHFGGNNYPLRGSKGTLYEGGSRVPAFIHSPLLKKTGYKYTGIFHIVDWYPTFLRLAGLKPSNRFKETVDLNGVDQWDSISENKQSARTEFPYIMDVIDGTVVAAVRVGDYKLIYGPGGSLDQWYTEAETTDQSFNPQYLSEYVSGFLPKPKRSVRLPFNLGDKNPKLYNLKNDPSEKNNIAESEPAKLAELLTRLQYYLRIAKPAVKMANDPAGDPDNFGGIFTPGWCKAYDDVPTEREEYRNQNIATAYLL